MGILSKAQSNEFSIGPVMRGHSKHILKLAKEDMSHKDGKLHPSMLSGCPTSAVIDILLLDNIEHPDNLLRIFDLGTAIHELLQRQLDEAGIIATLDNGEKAIEVPLSMPEFDLVGHADGIVYTRGDNVAVLEIKSINSMAFAKLEEPKPEHKIQATCYVLSLEKELGGSREICFIYYSKNDSKMKEFYYTVTDKDEEDVFKRIKELREMVADYRENPRAPEPKYKAISSPACRYCSKKKNCHDTFYRAEWNKRLQGKTDEPEKITQKKKFGAGRRKLKEAPKRKLGRSLKKRK